MGKGRPRASGCGKQTARGTTRSGGPRSIAAVCRAADRDKGDEADRPRPRSDIHRPAGGAQARIGAARRRPGYDEDVSRSGNARGGRGAARWPTHGACASPAETVEAPRTAECPASGPPAARWARVNRDPGKCRKRSARGLPIQTGEQANRRTPVRSHRLLRHPSRAPLNCCRWRPPRHRLPCTRRVRRWAPDSRTRRRISRSSVCRCW